MNELITRQPKWSDKPLFYRTDYVTYRKLKALKRWYWITVRDAAKWNRWAAKLYKTGKEPTVCEDFGHQLRGHRRPLQTMNGQVYLTWFSHARKPSVDGSDGPPFSAATVETINQEYELVKRWFMEKRGEADPLADITELTQT